MVQNRLTSEILVKRRSCTHEYELFERYSDGIYIFRCELCGADLSSRHPVDRHGERVCADNEAHQHQNNQKYRRVWA